MLTGNGDGNWRGETATGDGLGSFFMAIAATATGYSDRREGGVAATDGSDGWQQGAQRAQGQ